MYGVAELARMVEKGRAPLAETNSFLVREREVAGRISTALDEFRAWRDVAEEQVFALLYGSQPGIRRQRKESANREHVHVADGAALVIQDMQPILAAEGKMAEP
jgi:hypothetical protein